MSTLEFWWEFDYKMKVQKRITKRKDGFSEADWEAARKLHSEKVKKNG